MEDVSEVYLTDYIPTIYSSPRTIKYVQDGKNKICNIFAERNGVVIIIYNSTRNVLVLVKQFRPSAYIQNVFSETQRMEKEEKVDVNKFPPTLGITLEFCAGLEDKNIPSEEIAREEILEECGYNVDVSHLEKIGTIKNLTESTGANSTFYYCQVTDDMRLNSGGGVDGENIEVIEMPVEEVISYSSSREFVSSPINFMYGLYWFLYNKYNRTGCK
ncbi:uridine diphosphate glucose pyrophosphatase NUDT14 [Leptinotarsa decemlineata]|uniref:uridine diphosphate glucose pyrophosphatase NUDT14 n=1 Tax=Leptinotarsa decemlineata TaxID=7539 RepID=UPI003D305EB0